jgi:anion-transporting  ArsA/GET3 family ATPase
VLIGWGNRVHQTPFAVTPTVFTLWYRFLAAPCFKVFLYKSSSLDPMAFILSFIGKGGSGRSTLAIASAKSLAEQGQRVLLVAQQADPSLSMLLGQAIPPEPQTIAANLAVVQLLATQQLSKSWEQVKQLEAQYLRTPFFKNIFGQELSVLPGMDYLLALNALREYDASNQYDVIVLDGTGDLTFLRMLGLPEMMTWYGLRGKQAFTESDLGKTLAPFVAPVSAAVLNINFSFDNLPQPVGQAQDLLEQAQAAVNNPQRVAAFLVSTPDSISLASARYLWGSAQQMGITVAGLLLNQASNGSSAPTVQEQFSPLPITPLPTITPGDWQPLMAALPNLRSAATTAPRPLSIDIPAGKITLFLPGFDKTQVKLSQNGPEVTIEAGDQRRNIVLPPEWQGRSITGAKFQEGYLIISL